MHRPILFAVDDHPSAPGLDDPDGHPGRAVLDINATAENRAYRFVRKIDGLGLGSMESQETGAGTQDKGSPFHHSPHASMSNESRDRNVPVVDVKPASVLCQTL